MTNEQKFFTYKNPYDLLRDMQSRAENCILTLFNVDPLPCLSDEYKPMTCTECLQRWLGEEAK